MHDARLVVLGKSFGSTVLSVATVGMTVALTLVLLHQPVQLGNVYWLLVALAVVLLSGTAVGMLLGSIFIRTRYGPHISSALMYPVLLLGGMLVPPAFIPPVLRGVSTLISLRWIQQVLVSGANGDADWAALAAALALTAAYAVAAAAVFGRVVDAARREGTLELV